VLLVDDDQLDRKDHKRALRRAELAIQVFEACDGVEGLAALRGDRAPPIPEPRVVLLDLKMPRMGGVEFLEAVRNDSDLRQIEVFVLTTSTSDADKRDAERFAPQGYLVKPNNPEGLDLIMQALTTCYTRLCGPLGATSGPQSQE
jgi:CheY-like chemotaxis protein